MLKKAIKKMNPTLVNELKRIYYKSKIKKGGFVSQEVEYNFVKNLINDGDFVLDIGANVGHYTLLFSNLVGRRGRVVAFEPIKNTFSLLTENVQLCVDDNVTLINAAALPECDIVSFEVPNNNYYQSHISTDGDIKVVGVNVKSFVPVSTVVSFIKIDAEGCDEKVILSAQSLIYLNRPIVMAEIDFETAKKLTINFYNYEVYKLDGSHNTFLVPQEKSQIFKEVCLI